MKICVMVKSTPIHNLGGMENLTMDLCRGLVKEGHKVIIITSKHPNNLQHEILEKQIEAYFVGNIPQKYSENFFRESAAKFDELDEKENFNLIHSQSGGAFGVFLYSKSTKPIIRTSHGFWIDEMKTRFNRKTLRSIAGGILFYLKRLMRNRKEEKLWNIRTNRLIAISLDMKKKFLKYFKEFEGRVEYIPNGIDINRFKPIDITDKKKELELENSEILLFSGRIDREKGIHLIVEILPNLLKEFKNLQLIVTGKGPFLSELKQLIHEKGVDNAVRLMGYVADEDMAWVLNLADIFVFPTLRVEGLPLNCIEVMACGKPVIASNTGGIPTLITHQENGILIKRGNLDQLEENILNLLRNPKQRQLLGNNALKTVVENFSLEQMIKNTIELYKKVLDEH
jgi:glycosyltransferase involved in cell wall biosynthesis